MRASALVALVLASFAHAADGPTVVGSKTPLKPIVSGLVNPESACIGPFGVPFVTCIGEFNKKGDGTVVAIKDGKAVEFAKGLDDPKGIVFAQGFFFVTDMDRVWRIDRTGKATVHFKAEDFPVKPMFLNDIEVGPKGTLFQRVSPSVSVALEGGSLTVSRASESQDVRALHGLTRAMLNNMVTGVTSGFRKQLEIVGVGYKAEVQGGTLVLSLGYSHPVRLEIPKGLAVKAERPTLLTIEGADRQVVGEFAAGVRGLRPPEPYKGKGVKYAGEYIFRKEGKKK